MQIPKLHHAHRHEIEALLQGVDAQFHAQLVNSTVQDAELGFRQFGVEQEPARPRLALG